MLNVIIIAEWISRITKDEPLRGEFFCDDLGDKSFGFSSEISGFSFFQMGGFDQFMRVVAEREREREREKK